MQRTIEHLTHKWHLITWQVIELRPTPSTKIRELVKETYSTLHSLQKQELVPRATSALIYEMTEFVWWVGDLEETPLHDHFQILYNVIDWIRRDFITGDANTNAIEQFINEEMI